MIVNYKPYSMIRQIPAIALRRLAYSHTRLFSTLQMMKNCLSKDLYSIDLISKSVNRRILGMFYSPGVGAVC